MKINREDYLAPWSCELATEILRFDAIELVPLCFLKGKVYANESQTIPELKRTGPTGYCINWAIIPEFHQNVREKGSRVQEFT